MTNRATRVLEARSFVFGALAFLSASAVPVASEQERAVQGPREVVTEVTGKVMKILLDRELPESIKRQQVKDVVVEVVDFETVSKLILARSYKEFSPKQLEEFVAEFQLHLLFTYWKTASTYEFDRIEILSDAQAGKRDWTVKTRVVAKSEARMDYRLRRVDLENDQLGDWQIIDIIIEGVSLISNFRSQFGSLVSQGGPEHLLELLRKKNAEAEEKYGGSAASSD